MAKVLVVDDSLSVRKVVERALVGRRIDVVSAASGTEALASIERDLPDVVVCDVVMPDRDGYEICEFVKGHPQLSATPVLLMSGIVNDEVRARAAEVQSAGVLAKPFAAEDLLRKLDGLLAARVAAPPVPPPPAPAPVAPPDVDAALRADERQTPPVPAGQVAAAPRAAELRPFHSVREAIDAFGNLEGVQWAVVTDREGFVVEATANADIDADVTAALSACLAESSEGLGRELGRGTLAGVILEYDKGVVVIYGVGTSALLAVGLADPAALGRVRYFAKRAAADLARLV